MMKKALATAAAAGAIVAAGTGVASANTADQGNQGGGNDKAASLPDTTDICNAPTKENPDKENTYLGIVQKDAFPLLAPLPIIEPKTHVILGLCQETEAKADEGDDAEQGGGDQGGDQGGEETPAPDGDGNNGGGNDDPSNPSDGGAQFPVAGVL